MNNLEDLTLKVKEIIESEKSINHNIRYLNASHAKLISQIVTNYNLSETQNSPIPPQAQMIFLGGPTGAGKDIFVKKILTDNPDKSFVVLNMDVFRHYHNIIAADNKVLSDKYFASTTNPTSYELYYIIQEIILRLFHGTNVIVTGTMRDLSWVKEIVNRYKNTPKTHYQTYLYTLAVPITESAFSIFERYLNMVNNRGNAEEPLRYTDLNYYADTASKFLSTVSFFEDDYHKNPHSRLFDSIRVYRRNTNIYDSSENTLLFDSETSPEDASATSCISKIMHSKLPISSERMNKLLNIIDKNSDYLKSQGLYESILVDLKSTLPSLYKASEDIEK